MIEGIPKSTVHSYLQARNAIQEELDFITSLASMLKLFEGWDGPSREVDLPSLGKLHALIYRHACRVEEHLEGFLPLIDVEGVVQSWEDGVPEKND